MLNLGNTVILRDVPFQVVGSTRDGVIQLRCLNTGELRTEKTDDLLDAYVRDDLRLGIELDRKKRLTASEEATLRLDQMTTRARIESKRRIHYMHYLKRKGAFEPGTSRRWLQELIAEAAQEISDNRPPHLCSVYRWHSQHTRSDDLRSLFSRIGERGGKHRSRLDPVTEGCLHDCIEEALSRSGRWTAEEVHLRLVNKLSEQNRTRLKEDKLLAPSVRTIQRRLASLPAFDVAVSRFGYREAERRFRYKGASRRTTHVLELVEIDHSPLDILIVDKNGRVLPRPIITVVLDRNSRCVLGYHISLDGYGAKSVFEALRHALFPKSYLKTRFGGDLVWPCYGWFELLLMDNGAEFHSVAVEDALTNLGIGFEFARSRSPDDKPFVERFLRTLNYSFVHRLPGTTLAKYDRRIGFKSEDQAALTLEELDRLIHVWICQNYHLRPHAGLRGRTPLAVWEDSIKAFPPQLKCDAQDVEIEFSQTTTRELQHYGVDLNTFRYSSRELADLRRLLPAKARVDIKWPWMNVGHIYVWNPLETKFIRAANNEEEFRGLTHDQAVAVRKHRSSSVTENDAVRATAQSLSDDLSDAALEKRGSRSRRKGARLAGLNTAKNRKSDAEQVHNYQPPLDLFGKEDHDDGDDFPMEIGS